MTTETSARLQGPTRIASAPTPRVPAEALEHAIRHSALRGLGFTGMLAIALIHLLDVIGKIQETPYIGALYILLMLGSIGLAFVILHTGGVLAWSGAGGLAALTLVGFILSRTTGLPDATGDIGNWSEPLGLASMLIEAGVILLSGYALMLARREARPGLHATLLLPE
jgi:hypothetical protein